ncbi:LacI family DNA-binding transcriptional regulator [Prauserella cavernicola]|uniref:LacI family DNA-binding transcriptional regulator n=1 Tax=Prauserella cavernicola TaxID=2800127 RepID=A0A934V4U0_9PSEU|nr:LacI family DNA-binding transcriptional regulator [Prauserella cavernicola]MBK1783943.1 LacI family DNA-binding transcriptional regulator [Prauserella cavernicola]
MPSRPSRERAAKVTLNDVAMVAGVDRSVVSRVINGDPNLSVRQETRQRVLDAIDRLGYRPNAAARSLRTARAYMFGLVIPDFANPVYAEIIKGAERAAGNLGYGLMTASSGGVQLGLAHHLALLGQGRVDGLLFAGEETGHELEQLRTSAVPWLLVNRRIEGSRRYVVLDDERGSGLAVEHMVALGHRRIAHLAGPEGADTARRRRAGYTAAMTEAGLNPDPRHVVHADYTSDGGAAAMTALLRIEPRPTAVVVANVASAVGALHTLHEAGLSVPGDLSVIAIHDMPLAGHLVPALTTVRMPLGRLGERALELLATSNLTDDITEVVTEPVDVVVRASTAPPR